MCAENERSLRSGVKKYTVKKVTKRLFRPTNRDYSKILLDDVMESDKEDVLSDSDTDFLEASRKKDPLTGLDKKNVSFNMKEVDTLLKKYKQKHRRFPSWMTQGEKRCLAKGSSAEYMDEDVRLGDPDDLEELCDL